MKHSPILSRATKYFEELFLLGIKEVDIHLLVLAVDKSKNYAIEVVFLDQRR